MPPPPGSVNGLLKSLAPALCVIKVQVSCVLGEAQGRSCMSRDASSFTSALLYPVCQFSRHSFTCHECIDIITGTPLIVLGCSHKNSIIGHGTCRLIIPWDHKAYNSPSQSRRTVSISPSSCCRESLSMDMGRESILSA